jgi:hypothetical protein
MKTSNLIRAIIFTVLTMLSGSTVSQEAVRPSAPADVLAITCGTTKDVFANLKSKYEEQVEIGGIVGTGSQVMLMWVNHQTHSWTITVTSVERTCIIASGYDLKYQNLKKTSF